MMTLVDLLVNIILFPVRILYAFAMQLYGGYQKTMWQFHDACLLFMLVVAIVFYMRPLSGRVRTNEIRCSNDISKFFITSFRRIGIVLMSLPLIWKTFLLLSAPYRRPSNGMEYLITLVPEFICFTTGLVLLVYSCILRKPEIRAD